MAKLTLKQSPTGRSAADVATIWRHTHPDFRGIVDGTKCVLVNRGDQGTCSVAIEQMTDAEFAMHLGVAKKREERGQRPYR